MLTAMTEMELVVRGGPNILVPMIRIPGIPEPTPPEPGWDEEEAP